MALEIGAAPNGDFGSYHAEPIDPRSGIAEPAIFTFPYGILVNKVGRALHRRSARNGRRPLRMVTRRIFEQPDGLAWLILDARIEDVPNWRRQPDRPAAGCAPRSPSSQRRSSSSQATRTTIEAYNSACVDGEFKPLERTAWRPTVSHPAKSNWARPIDRAPFGAFPVISANVFTFGGLKADRYARVLDHRRANPIPRPPTSPAKPWAFTTDLYRLDLGPSRRGVRPPRRASRERRSQMTSRIALVVGGAGMIGGAIAERLRRDGYEVVTADLDGADRRVDVTNQSSVREFDPLLLGDLACLVNAFGVTSKGSFETITADEWERVHDANLRGVFFACQAAIPALRRSGGGRIVNIGSVLAKNGDTFALAPPRRAEHSANAAYGSGQGRRARADP